MLHLSLVLLLIPAETPTFESGVQQIFVDKCGKCHGEKVQKADLRLDQYVALLKGGESGAVIRAGHLEESSLWEMVHEGAMPPDGQPQLTPPELEQIRRWISTGATSRNGGALRESEPTYLDVIPVMLRRCVMCHGGEYQRGGIDLRTYDSVSKIVVPGNAASSLLMQRVTNQQCPPANAIGEAGIEPMTPAETLLVQKWIHGGATAIDLHEDVATEDGDALVTDAERQFWSFQPPHAAPTPALTGDGPGRAYGAVDAFVHRRLKEQELDWATEADRYSLLRRAAYAVTGLPPDQEMVTRFLSDQRPGAYERVVEDLLASPAYGEKWGRFWLDLAGYSDSEGKRNADMIRPYAWKYRDWVIRAFNSDMPYDQFLLEQLAGDELVDWGDSRQVTPEVVQTLVATGFLRMAPDGTSADPVNRYSDRLEVISDTVDVVSRGLMGLTMNCARCHTHKYDPIPQRDYYRFVAIFKGAYDEYDWLTPQPFNNQWKDAKQRHLPIATTEEAAEIESRNKVLRVELEELKRELNVATKAKDKASIKNLKKKITDIEAQLEFRPKIRALWDRGRPSPTFVYRRGDEMQPAQLVGPGVPSALTDGRTPFVPVALDHATPKTGRRLRFAHWLTKRDHPLTSRVFVNRIWQQMFGVGIVASVDNFGKLGTAPSHPQLLDWLANDFSSHGWSIKRLHRQILLSTTWRQQSGADNSADPENRWLSRMPLRRLEAEEVRDTLLALADRWNQRRFGEPDPVDVRKDGLVVSKAVHGGWRRSVYVRQRRKEMPTIFETFDLPQMNPNCSQRKASTVVTQPLHLLNNAMVHGLARDFARRVFVAAGHDVHRQVTVAFHLLLQRDPSAEERAICAEVMGDMNAEILRNRSDAKRAKTTKATKANESPANNERADEPSEPLVALCHGLMNSASFLYVD